MELEIFSKKIIPSTKIGFLGATLILFYILDFLGKVGFIHDNFMEYLALIVKPIFLIGMFIYLAKHNTEIDKRLLYGILILCVTFVIGQLSLNTDNHWLHLIQNVKVFAWYLLPFPIYIFLKIYHKNHSFAHLRNAFEWIFIINTFFLLIGLLFGIDILRTYNETRFGYIGLFRNNTQGSYIYLVYTLYYYFKYQRDKSYEYKFMWIVAMLASILTGTKLLLLFCLCMLVYALPYRKTIIATITATAIGLFFLIQTNWFIENITKKYFLNLYEVYNERGLISLLFSLRNELFAEKFVPYIKEQWTFVNYFFGGGSFHLYRSQLEYIDLFWFFGIIGTLVFLYLWFKIIGKKWIFHPLFICMWILLGLAGNFFSSLTTCIHFLILIYYLKYSRPNILLTA